LGGEAVSYPPFLRHPDPELLSVAERQALRKVRDRFLVGSQTDNWHAGLRYGGHVLRLTLDTLDIHASRYERWCWSENIVLSPEGVA
jgi:hypothetical protein